MLFKPEHVEPILSGRKTQTRRLWPHGRRAVPGSLHWAATKLYDPTARFARLRIESVEQEPLGWVTPLDARAEGYDGVEEFLAVFDRINGNTPRQTLVWVVSFEVVAA